MVKIRCSELVIDNASNEQFKVHVASHHRKQHLPKETVFKLILYTPCILYNNIQGVLKLKNNSGAKRSN